MNRREKSNAPVGYGILLGCCAVVAGAFVLVRWLMLSNPPGEASYGAASLRQHHPEE